MITTRLAATADIPACADLHVESCLDIYRPYVSAEAHATTLPGNLRAIWADERLIGGDFINMAYDGDELLGIATVREKPIAYIDHFHVRPVQKSQGVGRILMRATAAELIRRGKTECYLDVADGNDAALAFYQAMGGQLGEMITGDLFGHPLPARIIRWPDITAINV